MELLHWDGTSTIRRTLTGTFWGLTALDSEAFAAVPRHAESTVVVADASGFTEVGLGDVVAASVAGGCGGRLYINAYRRGADSDVRLAELDLRAGHTRELHWSAEGTLGVRVDGPWLVSTTVADAGRALVRRVDRPSPTSMTHDGRVANLTTLDGELMVCAVDTSGTRMLVGVNRGISDECWIVDISTGEAARLSGDDAGFGTFAFFDGEDAVWMESTPSGGPVLRRAEGALVREEPLVDAVVATPSLSWPCHVDTRTVRTADDQHDVEAIVLTPEPWDEQHVVVALHGGPRSRWTRKHNQLHQTLVWAGVRVVAPNTRGSSSYDRSFERSLRGRWGDVDQSDLVEVVRAVRADTPQATVVLMGVSYGAYQAFQAVISDPQLADGVVIAAGFIGSSQTRV